MPKHTNRDGKFKFTRDPEAVNPTGADRGPGFKVQSKKTGKVLGHVFRYYIPNPNKRIQIQWFNSDCPGVLHATRLAAAEALFS